MAETSIVRGRVARLTRLDALGRPRYGPGNQVVTKGIIQVQYSPNVDEPDAQGVTNFANEQCVPASPGCPSINNWTVEVQFCSVDPCTVLMIYPSWIPYFDDFGGIKGYQVVGSMSCDVGFALEVWGVAGSRGQQGARCGPGAVGAFRYVLAPRLISAAPGDFTIAADPTTFTFSGTTTTPVGWRRGPYLVDVVDGRPSILRDPVSDDGQLLDILTDVAPPAPTDGCVDLPRPIPEPADIVIDRDPRGAVEGMCVRVIVDNHGFGPAIVDWGDGTEPVTTPDCSFVTHCYETAGEYTICVRDQQTPVVQNCRTIEVPLPPDEPVLAVSGDDEDDMCVVAEVTMPPQSDGRVLLEWGDDSEPAQLDLEPGQTGTVRHCYQQAGFYQITATRLDQPIYRSSQTVLVPTQDNPTVSSSVDGLCATLTVDNHGNGVTQADWGDGTVTQGPDQDGGTVTHCYETAGTYTVVVTSIANPSARTTVTVTVEGPGGIDVTVEPDMDDETGMTAIVSWTSDAQAGVDDQEGI